MRISEMSAKEHKVQTDKKKTINEAYEELKGCSSEELMQRLCKEINGQKQSGTFDCDGLRASVEKIKTYLPSQTYENMIRIIESFR